MLDEPRRDSWWEGHQASRTLDGAPWGGPMGPNGWKNTPKIGFLAKMTKKIRKNHQNAKKSKFFVRTSFPPYFLLFKNPPKPFFGKNWQKLTKKCNFELRQKCDMPEGSFTPYFLLVQISKTHFFQPGFWKSPDFAKNRIWKKTIFKKNVGKLWK